MRLVRGGVEREGWIVMGWMKGKNSKSREEVYTNVFLICRFCTRRSRPRVVEEF